MLLNGVAFAQVNVYCQTDGIDTLFSRNVFQNIVFEVQRTFAKDKEYTLLRVTLEGSSKGRYKIS